MKLAILIPYTPDRQILYTRLVGELETQIGDSKEVAILSLKTPLAPQGPTTGEKRNTLIQMAIDAGAECIAFFDSDDMPGPTYIKRGLDFADSGMDCAELWGQIYWSGKPGKPFHHYMDCTHAWEDDKEYHRPPNHLNFWILDKVKDFKFQDKTFGEDMCWAMDIRNSGVIKTMMPISEVIYNYYVGEPKNAI